MSIYLLTLGCFLLSLHNSQGSPAQTYYQFSSRMFEFLLGACIVFIPRFIEEKPGLKTKLVLNFSAVAALVSLFYIAQCSKILLGYPNYYALAVCLATGLLILISRSGINNVVIQLLSLKPVVFLGLLSYSLYIWHWPVLAFLRYESIVESSYVLSIAFIIIFLLSYLSWRYIEVPARHLKTLPFAKTCVCLLVLPALMIHGTDYWIKKKSGLPQRFNSELVRVYEQLNQYNSVSRPLCISNDKTPTSQCWMGDTKPEAKKALLIGDSFSNHYWGLIDVLGKASQVSVLAQGTSSCIALPGLYLFDWWHFKNSIYRECHDQTQRYYQMIKENHYDYVIIGQIWPNYVSTSVINQLGDERSLPLARHRIEIALEQALQEIIATKAKPVLIKATSVNEHSNNCFYQHIKLHQPYDPNQCSFPLTSDRWLEQLFARMAKKYPQLALVDPNEILCPNNRCKADINGVPVYRDAGHLTDFASYQLGLSYIAQGKNFLM